jgi:cytochrome-b5 reductase
MLAQTTLRGVHSVARHSLISSSRRLSTQPTKQSPAWPLFLAIGGAGGLAGWVYLSWSEAKPPSKPIQEKSPLDPQNFLPFKLKAVVPYNHNTSKCGP